MQELVEDAYMNGYNWDAFLNVYLKYNAPEILDVFESDPEAGMYSSYTEEVTEDNKALAQKLADIIEHLIENEQEIYDFLEQYGEEIEWD